MAAAAFDAALRARHADALAQLSPQVRAQLAQRRNAALRGEMTTRSPQRLRLRLAVAGTAALCALAVGLRLTLPTPSATPAAMSAPALAQATPTTGGSMPLDEDPDFYAWLGSADATRLAME
ncbi:hypothetical protein [Thermomonas sp.]|uniref:hypothetical protein n=1 Tax=Thermomonas sp. TaxID=1971895 RepID=UPI00391890EE